MNSAGSTFERNNTSRTEKERHPTAVFERSVQPGYFDVCSYYAGLQIDDSSIRFARTDDEQICVVEPSYVGIELFNCVVDSLIALLRIDIRQLHCHSCSY